MIEPTCTGCGKVKPIKSLAMNFCNACYVQFRRTGSVTRERMPRGQCTVPGCDKQAHGRGLCHMHLRRQRLSGSLDDPRADRDFKSGHKMYSQWANYQRPNAYPIIEEWKTDFFAFLDGVGERPSSKHRLYRKDKTQPLGPDNFEWRERYVSRSSEETDVEYNLRRQKALRVATGIGSTDWDLRSKYGPDFGRAELAALAEMQDHKCAICGKPETVEKNGTVKHLAVDHRHADGKIRGLLCQAHNVGLGYFNDDPELLRKAIKYLSNPPAFAVLYPEK